MRLPNKVTSYEESVLSKLIPIIEVLSQKSIPIFEIYTETKEHYCSCTDFIDALDCLFALGKIEYLENEEILHYVA